ncbi:MAG: Rho-binding antiterminator [Pseudomonadota bacterium]|uniref:Rho-binding antiterminator n=1 Tax=Methylophaga aminisulfidivorans TaxID=230105 RepID=UPI0024E1A2E4|nr:Rho-binding antiterminator [Methylophaga aminisulfidivorans]MEC9412788.1 Rho-binding antiterminator [Pseudomonadota bacterium]
MTESQSADTRISCSDYDRIELICLCQYPIQLTLQSGDTVKGIPFDTAYTAERKEGIKIKVKNETLIFTLQDIIKITILIDNQYVEDMTLSNK